MIRLIAASTVREASRRKLVALALLIAAAFLLLYALAWRLALSNPHNIANRTMDPIMQRQGEALFLLLGLYAANMLTGMAAILASLDTLSGEIASGAVETLLSKPLARAELFLGKWLGLVGLLSGFMLALEGGVMLVAWLFSDYTAPNPVWGLGLLWIEMALLVTLTMLWGTRLSTLANGVASLGLFGFAFLGGWIEQIGALTRHPAAVEVGIAASLVMPSEALWRRAAFEMQSPLMGILRLGPFASASVPSGAMVAYAALYLAAALGLGLRLFSTRDL